jgi:dUTP pyrophosphatase
MPAFRVKKLYDDALLPHRAHNTDSGLDLFAYEGGPVLPAHSALIGTGLCFEIPHGYGGFITPRSGLALSNRISVLNTPGLIDSGYRGEVKVILYNHGSEEYWVNTGDRIAQLVIISTPLFDPIEVEELNVTKRGSGGFGSTD